MSLADQPAFPVPGHVTGDRDRNGDPIVEGADPGMTYRQWLVGKALEGLCANPALLSIDRIPSDEKKAGEYGYLIAELSLKFADAAIRAQEKP